MTEQELAYGEISSAHMQPYIQILRAVNGAQINCPDVGVQQRLMVHSCLLHTLDQVCVFYFVSGIPLAS